MRHLRVSLAALLLATSTVALQAQKPEPPKPAAPPDDVVIFTNGDQLTGKLIRAESGHVVFASKMAGTLEIPFANIKTLRSGAEFALLRKGTVPTRNAEFEGTIDIHDDKVYVTASSSTNYIESAADVTYLIPAKEYDHQVSRKAGFTNGWSGKATGGASLVRSTQTGSSFNFGLNLVRAIPTVPWMPLRNRTVINGSESYGKLSTPVIPQTNPASPPSMVLTNISHADAERDQYFSPRFYALATASFDHNNTQGLGLQQVYGGGFGVIVLKSAKQELDVTGSLHYELQQFITTAGTAATANANLIGATVADTYTRHLPKGLLLTQTANILPAFNNTGAYSANITAGLILPVYKHIGANVSVTDNYLNDPTPGYNNNSFQFVTGVAYTLP